TGRAHFRANPNVSDEDLYQAGYNRVYDTIEPEQNLDDVERVVFEVLQGWDPKEVACSWKLNRAIGRYLNQHVEERGILKSAYEKDVAVVVPAFTDSDLDRPLRCHSRHRTGKVSPFRGFVPLKIVGR